MLLLDQQKEAVSFKTLSIHEISSMLVDYGLLESSAQQPLVYPARPILLLAGSWEERYGLLYMFA